MASPINSAEKEASEDASVKKTVKKAVKKVAKKKSESKTVTKTKTKKTSIKLNEDTPAETDSGSESGIRQNFKISGMVLKADSKYVEDLLKGKKIIRHILVTEVNEVEERINKKKYSEVRPIESLTRCSRSKERRMEESAEELISRIARELEEEQAVRENPFAENLCAKCNEFPILETFRIDKGFGYCEFCADLLNLGQTKEAKSFEFGLGRKKESTDEDAAI